MTPGTEVVCVNTKGVYNLEKNRVYRVISTRQSVCKCSAYLVNVGNEKSFDEYVCCFCGGVYSINDGVHWYHNTRFVPIDSIKITEVEELLQTEPFTI